MKRATPPLTLLAFFTVASLSAAELQPLVRPRLDTLRAQESIRAELVTQDLNSRKAMLGLSPEDGLLETGRQTDAYGRTHVHFQQTYQGVKVWNSHLIGHLDADGRTLPVNATVRTGIRLAPMELLPEARIEALAQKHLSQDGEQWPLKIEKIVLPSSCQDKIKWTRNEQGNLVIDSKYSVGTPARTTPYVWAYHVSALSFAPGGPEAVELIFDGHTGELLKKWDGAQRAAEPATGTGKSYYNGTIPLSTEKQSDGTYRLRDTTRATKAWPFLNQQWPELSGIGIETYCYNPRLRQNSSGFYPILDSDNFWGDGKKLFNGDLTSESAQTAAVDAHYYSILMWDYLNNVLGRTGGIDGKGSSVINLVHSTWGGMPIDVASWMPSWFMMKYGDYAGDAGLGFGPRHILDWSIHEMSHGVMAATANLESEGEAGGICEADADNHASMVKFWAWGAGAQGSVVPDATTACPDGNNDPLHVWTMAFQLAPDTRATRYPFKPSKSGNNYDAWFDGMSLDNVYLKMGPGIRAFYFMAQGSSSDSASEAHSAYLPGGMNGIGNDKAIKIWFNAMTTKVTDSSTDYHALRSAMIASAEELFPSNGTSDSNEVAAVKNAFSAVNVGGSELPLVKIVNEPGANDIFLDSHFLVMPAAVSVPLPVVDVENTTDKTIEWSLGGLDANNWPTGGKLVDNRFFVAPAVWSGVWPIKAALKSDAKEFSTSLVFATILDCDSDAEVDACDMGAIALSYRLNGAPYLAADVYGAPSGVDDICCQLFLMGFKRAFTL